MSDYDFPGMMRGWAAIDSIPQELKLLLRDAAAEIDRLRQAAGAVSAGQSFADIKATTKCAPNATTADAR
jgi:hypothetical protein